MEILNQLKNFGGMIEIANLFWLVAGPIVWITIGVLGYKVFNIAKKSGGTNSRKISFLPSGSIKGMIAKTFILTLLLTILGLIYIGIQYSFDVSDLSQLAGLVVVIVADIGTIYLIKIYLSIISMVKEAVRLKNMNVLQNLPLFAFETAIFITILFQVTIVWFAIGATIGAHPIG